VEGEFDWNRFLHIPVCRCHAGCTHVASFRHGNHVYTYNQLKEKQLFLYIGTGPIDLKGHASTIVHKSDHERVDCTVHSLFLTLVEIPESVC